MYRTLKELFSTFAAPFTAAEPGVSDRDHALQLASAVLMVEVMRVDTARAPQERQTAIEALRTRFALGEDEVARLLELAEATSSDAPDLYGFTSQLNKGFDLAQKVQIVEYLWQVAYADGHLSADENHLLLKLGDLLYLPRGEFVGAKQRGRRAAGVEDPGTAAPQ